MKPQAILRSEELLASTASSWTPITGRGYSIAERWLVRFCDGSTAFVKHAVNEHLAESLRAEHRIYAVEADFLPRLVGWDDSGLPILLLEDLSGDAVWPPPWSPDGIAAVLHALTEIASFRGPKSLVRLEDDDTPGWVEVAVDPKPFLSLGVRSTRWLDESLPTLLDATAETPLSGNALVQWTCAATTSASVTGEQFCSTGIKPYSATHSLTWPSGCPASRLKVALHPKRSLKTSLASARSQPS
jgi:hypothetical protein